MENSHSFGPLDPKHFSATFSASAEARTLELTIFNAVRLLFHGQVGSGVLIDAFRPGSSSDPSTHYSGGCVRSFHQSGTIPPSMHNEAADQID
ncbi:hypothetical protein GYMLUDRAFT_49310 [Collybiopsis luxurians FD-317 M1]|uniref:Uncharacterized protein n=1 Tax=Collybiopsis luxurians FD-317 M1 TaxID=944289 RepID=A0A0D0C6T2_9AGAR|nr:hypothetical protein GYMLUDRAFT_49310 [Collybiopsis luxurians FD-317 M1]